MHVALRCTHQCLTTQCDAGCRYPGEIIPGLLYLGNWEHAQDFSALQDLGIKRCASAAPSAAACQQLLLVATETCVHKPMRVDRGTTSKQPAFLCRDPSQGWTPLGEVGVYL